MKKILIIESDDAFRGALANAVSQYGYAAIQSGDSEAGLELARSERPDLIVACVEAKPTNGYMVCTRLKKDAAMQSIPVILTSATATADAFQKHKQLKTHAEAYLTKPFDSKVFLQEAQSLIGPAAPEEKGGGLFSSEEEAITLADLDIDEPATPTAASLETSDSDFSVLDQAFNSFGLPGLEMAVAGTPAPPSSANLEARVAQLEQALATKTAELEEARAAPQAASPTAPLRAKISEKEKEILRLRAELSAKDTELLELNEKLGALEEQVAVQRPENNAELEKLRSAVPALAAELTRAAQGLAQAQAGLESARRSLAALAEKAEKAPARPVRVV